MSVLLHAASGGEAGAPGEVSAAGAGAAGALELRLLRYFVAVAEAGQISLAAERLFMTQPALSQAVRRLEEQLGVTLFRRHAGGTELTEAGAAVLQEARAALAAAERVATTAQRHADRRPALAIGFLEELLEHLLAPLEQFAAGRPDVELSVRELSIVAQEQTVRSGSVDVALLCPTPPDVDAEWLTFERLFACVGRGHRLADRVSVTFADLAGERFPGVHPDIPAYWADAFAPPGAVALDRGEQLALTPEEVRALVVAGQVVTLSPDFLVRRYAEAPFVAIPVVDAAPLPVGFATTRAQDPTVADFLAFVRDYRAERERLDQQSAQVASIKRAA